MCRMAENHQTDAGHDAAAIARWDDEGGAAASFADKTAPKYRRMDPSEVAADACARKKIGPATDAATNFVRSIQAHSGL
jgi:hypothetical protein